MDAGRLSTRTIVGANVIVLVFMVCVTSTKTVPPTSDGAANKPIYCPSIDIRNNAASIGKYSNCTIVEGSVQIVLLDRSTEEDFANISFSALREITEYLLVFRVKGLKSLGQLFPNLALIRGTALFSNMALAVYMNNRLQELGLKSLTHILEGSVLIYKNNNLCFADSISWDSIMKLDSTNRTVYEVVIGNNKESRDCGSQEKCRALGCKRDLCWSANDCQLLTLEGCHRLCAGGCYKNNSEYDCYSCSGLLTDDGECVSQCPNGSYEYKKIRCIGAEKCRQYRGSDSGANYFIFNRSCIKECPSQYRKEGNTCQKCDDCTKTCTLEAWNANSEDTVDTYRILTVSSSRRLHSCTHINASLEIEIKTGTYSEGIENELKHNLGMIQEISGQLKIMHSHALVSLNFLSNLRLIGGRNVNDTQPALIVKDNNNLSQLWDWKRKPRSDDFRIAHGTILFHFNPKLCLSEIDKLVQVAKLAPYTELEVSQGSNGYKTTCNTVDLNVTIVRRESNSVILSIGHMPSQAASESPSKVKYLGRSILYYRENTNSSVNESAIYQSFSECGDSEWKARDVLDSPGNSGTVDVILTNLEPNVQYVFFLTTYTMSSSSMGTSRLFNFTTLPAQPSMPLNFNVNYTTPNEAAIFWNPPYHAHGELTHYKLTARWQTDDVPGLRKRDYCKYKNEPVVGNRFSVSSVVSAPSTTTAATTTVSNNNNNNNRSNNNNNNNNNNNGDNNNNNNTNSSGGSGAAASLSSSLSSSSSSNCNCKKATVGREMTQEELCNSFEHKTDFDARLYEGSGLETCDAFIYSVINDRYLGLVASAANDDTLPFDNLRSLMTTESHPTIQYADESNSDVFSNSTGSDGRYETLVMAIPKEMTSVVLTNLRHYSEYILLLSACRKSDPDEQPFVKRCSREALLAVRTDRSLDADRVTNLRVATVNQTVNISWDEPRLVNSFVHSYQLEYRNADSDYAKFVEQCVTKMEFQARNYSYTIDSLPAGHYSVRLKAISLGGDGPYAEAEFRIAEPVQSYTGTVILSSLLIVVVTSAILIGGFFYYWRIIGQKDGFATLIASVNPRYEPVYLGDQWEVPRENVTIVRQLGRGIFGSVFEAVLHPNDIKCAVKTTSSDDESNYMLSKEAQLMKEFHHAYHIVRLLGVVSKDRPVYVIMELMERGDLKTYLLNSASSNLCDPNTGVLPFPVVVKMAAEIADGMAFLESKKFVHRDLAARNCMVSADGTIKIGDFGLARDIYETDYYRKGDHGTLPIRWMAPESIRDGVFTSHSDVWSYGVVLWEMLTLAQMPYHPKTNKEVMRYVQSRQTLDVPFYCDPLLRKIMLSCWKWHFSHRPRFTQILKLFEPYMDDDFRRVSYYHNGESPASGADNPVSCSIDQDSFPFFDDAASVDSISSTDDAKTAAGIASETIQEEDEDAVEDSPNVQLKSNSSRSGSPCATSAVYYNYRSSPAKNNGYVNTFSN